MIPSYIYIYIYIYILSVYSPFSGRVGRHLSYFKFCHIQFYTLYPYPSWSSNRSSVFNQRGRSVFMIGGGTKSGHGAKTLYVYLLTSSKHRIQTSAYFKGEDNVFVRTIYYYILCIDTTGPYIYLKSSLKPSAIPRIFKDVPSYLSKPTPEARDSPSKRRKLVGERHDGQQRDWIDADRIISYQDFKVSVEQHLLGTHI